MGKIKMIKEKEENFTSLKGGVWDILNKYGIYTIEEALKVGETLTFNIGMFVTPIPGLEEGGNE